MSELFPPNVYAPEDGLPEPLDGLVTEDEAARYAVLARNAEIRRLFVALRQPGEDGRQRTVSGCLVALAQDAGGPGNGLEVEALRRIVYGQSYATGRACAVRPWLDRIGA